MMQTNSEIIKELKKIVKEESLRYKLIFLGTYLGSYEARRNLPSEGFQRRKITTSIEEARYIAEQHKKTLELLELLAEKPPSEVLEDLSERIKTLKEKVPTEGFYNLLSYFAGSEGLTERIGKRFEAKILDLNHGVIPKSDDYALKNAYHKEISGMQAALLYERQFIR